METDISYTYVCICSPPVEPQPQDPEIWDY